MRKLGYSALTVLFVASLVMLQFGLLCWVMPMMWHPWFSKHLLMRVVIPGLILIAGSRAVVQTARFIRKFELNRDDDALHTLHLIIGKQGIAPDDVRLVAHTSPIAFCSGLLRPVIVISHGLVERLSEKQLIAVLLHEEYHRQQRDPLRILLIDAFCTGFFFLPALQEWRTVFRASLEMAADNYAVQRVGKAALAGALHRLLTGPTEALPLPNAAAGLSINALRVANLLGDRSSAPRVSAKSLLISTVLLWIVCMLML